MNRLDIEKLRKSAGMSQRHLAELLQVRPSFLSAIENGRSRLPEDKFDKIKSIFPGENLDDFLISDEELAERSVPPHTHSPAEGGDALTQLLKHIHAQAHMMEGDTFGGDQADRGRIEELEQRNDRLSARVDDLRDQVDALREENFRLKELLTLNGIRYC